MVLVVSGTTSLLALIPDIAPSLFIGTALNLAFSNMKFSAATALIVLSASASAFVANGFSFTVTNSNANLSPSALMRIPTMQRNSGLYMAMPSSNERGKFKFRSKLNRLKESSKSRLSSSTGMNINFANLKDSPKEKLFQLFAKLRNLNEVTKWRIAAYTFVSSIFIFSNQLDIGMINMWNFLQNGSSLLPRMFRHDHWEWGVAVWAFFFWIHGFWLADKAVAKADARGFVHPWKKYRLQDQYEAEKFRRMQLRIGERERERGSVSAEQQQQQELEQAEPSATKQQKWHLGFWIFELPLYCLPLYIWDICDPRRAGKLATWGAPTALGVCKDVTCALLLYDLGFFVCHYLMHKIPFLYKHVHAKHHVAKEVRASDIVRLSFVEEIADVGISILALNFLKCHPVSRTMYNIIITFMLTELHSGFAFPWTPQFVVPFGLATGSKGHHYHHRNGEHYYQKFFCHVDKLFGFVQKKDNSLKGFSVKM